MQIGENSATATATPPATDTPVSEEQSQDVELVRVEIYTRVNGAPFEDHRRLAPLSTDAVEAWAVIWARPRDSSEQPRPYSSRLRSFPEATNALYCVGRGGANGQRPQRRAARPDLTGAFRPPNLAHLSSQRLGQVEVDPWPVDWPDPTFEWSELEYTTTRTGANDPRPYTYSGSHALTPDADSGGFIVSWADGAEPGVHRLSVTVRVGSQSVSCPASVRERNRGYVTTLLVRDGNVDGTDFAVQGRALGALPHRLPAVVPQVISFLRWMSTLLGTPYERGGCWIGGTSLASAEDPPLGYQGYGVDCTGLPSAVWTIAGLPQPSRWRFSTHGQHNPIPGSPLHDDYNDWQWTRRGWQQRDGAFHRYGPGVLAYVQPGDFFDSGPDSPLNHIRIIYAVVSRDFAAGDAQIRIIEASSSEAGLVRLDPDPPATMSLRDCLDNRRMEYGLWRPQLSPPSANPFATP